MFEVFAAIFIPTVAIIPVCLVVYFYIDERNGIKVYVLIVINLGNS